MTRPFQKILFCLGVLTVVGFLLEPLIFPKKMEETASAPKAETALSSPRRPPETSATGHATRSFRDQAMPGHAPVSGPTLAGFGSPTIEQCIEVLRSSTEAERVRAALALGRRAGAKNAAQKAVPALIAALDDEDPQVRAVAARVLGSFGSGATDAIPHLTGSIGDPMMRSSVIRALGKMGPEAEETASDIAGVLTDTAQPVVIRRLAIEALASIGTSDPDALRALQQAREDADKTIRLAAEAALR